MLTYWRLQVVLVLIQVGCICFVFDVLRIANLNQITKIVALHIDAILV